MSRYRFIHFFLLALVITAKSAVPGLSQNDTSVAVVQGVPITEAQIDAIVESRSGRLPADPEEARRRALELLAGEIALEESLKAQGTAFAPDVTAALLDARRQILFQFYAQAEFDPTPPTREEIDAYIEANPQFFSDRREYRLLRATVQPRNAADREAARNVIERLSALPEITEDAFNTALVELARRDVPFTRQLFWNGGEVLEPPTLSRLERMWREGREFDVQETAASFDAIRLLDVREAPIDPEFLRAQIADRILTERFQAHQDDLIRALAAPYLAAQPASDAATPPPPAGSVPAPDSTPAVRTGNDPAVATRRFDRTAFALFGFGALGALAAFGAVAARQWFRAATLLGGEAADRGKGADEIGYFDRRKTAALVSAAALVAVTLASAVVAWRRLPTLPEEQVAVYGVGGAILGLAAGLILSLSRPLYEVRPATFALALFWGTVLHLSVAALLLQTS